MFGWVLNTLLPLDGYYLHGLNSFYLHIVVPEYYKNVVSRSWFQGVFIFEIQNCFFFFDPKYFWSLCFRITLLVLEQNLHRVITSYNNAVLYKINTFIKKQYFMVQLEINWRKKLTPWTDAAFHIFFQKAPLISYVWIFLAIFILFFVIQASFRLVLICVDSFWTRVDSCRSCVGSC